MAANLTEPEIPEWMKKALECPVCLDIIMDPPVFVCDHSQGHSMCSNCHKSIQLKDNMCPVCRGPLGNRRNLCLESLVENIPNKITCMFDGCDFKRSKEAVVAKHEESCEYRLVPCAQCNTEVSVKELAEHINNCGRTGDPIFFDSSATSSSVILRSAYSLPINMRRQQVMKNRDDPSMNFLMNWHTMDGGGRVFWISYIGPRKMAKTFKYTLKVQANPADKPHILEGAKKCAPCDLSFDEVKRKVCAVFLDKESIEEATEGRDDVDIPVSLIIEKV